MGTIRFRTAFHVGEDLDSLVGFYTEAMGFKLKFRDGRRWAEFQVGDNRFALGSPEEAPAGMRAGAVSVFQVTELGALLEKVVQAGGKVLDVRDMGAHGRVATLLDPAGTVFQALEVSTT
jgi:predicted enzyme related to lactoylglutathione lyase